MPIDHLRIVPVHSYYNEPLMGIKWGRRVIGYRAVSDEWRGPFRLARPDAVADMALRKSAPQPQPEQ